MEKLFQGKTVDDAVAAAAKELGISVDDVSYEIDRMEVKGGLFGIGAKPAVIKVFVEGEDAVEEKKSDKKVEKSVFGDKETEKFISEYIKSLFSKMDISTYGEEISFRSENAIDVKLSGEDIEVYTQRNCDIVDSLQFLLAVTVNKKFDKNYKITLNFNDYKERSSAKLEALAVKTAKQVLKTKRKVTLRPMSSYQRRIIHSKIHDFENVTTFSTGVEPNRKVVIAYDGPDKPLHLNEDGTVGRQGERRPSRPNGNRNGRGNQNRGGNASKPSVKSAGTEKLKILYPGPFEGEDN